MLIDSLLQQIAEEWAVVKAAPLMFGSAVLLLGFLIFLGLEWLHREKVSTLEHRLAAKETEEWMSLFRQRETLEEEVLQLKLRLPGFRIRSASDQVLVGIDDQEFDRLLHTMG